MTKNKLDNETRAFCEAFVRQYPKPVKTNNVISSVSSILTFYDSKDANGKKYYEYMNLERMLSLLYQVYSISNQKDEIKDKAAMMINTIVEKYSC